MRQLAFPALALVTLASLASLVACSSASDVADPDPIAAPLQDAGAGEQAADASAEVANCSSRGVRVGEPCRDEAAEKVVYSVTLAPRQYVRARLVSTEGSAVFGGAYVGDSLRVEETGAAPTLAFYNDSDAPLGVSLDVTPTAARAAFELDVRAAPYSPTASCAGDCAELLELPAPRVSAAYRIVSPPRYQFGRRELVQMIAAAASGVKSELPAAPPLGVGDISEASGDLPGTDLRKPRHPAPSHTQGFSADIAYFTKTGGALGETPACPTPDGEFCSGPHDLDLAPNALMMIALAKSGRLVQIIVDPVMEADLRDEVARQKAAGADGVAADAVASLLVSGISFHADHFHIAVSRACYDGKDNDGDGKVDLDDPDCTDALDDTE